MSRVIVAGLGPAGPELITAEVQALLVGGHPLFLRTTRHPAATHIENASSFDSIYESAVAIEEVYPQIVEALVAAAAEHGTVVYLVPGSPLVAETSVALLQSQAGVDVEVLPALSFLDLAWSRLGVDPLETGPRLVDGHRFATDAAGERGPLLVAQCDSTAVLSDIKLAFEEHEPEAVTVLQRLGLPDERVERLPWDELDRLVDADHLTSLWIPEVAAPVASELARVDEVARRLRLDCPWDREQTHESLTRYAIEETYELIDAIETAAKAGEDASDDHLIEELGDVLFQVFAHCAIAAEQGRFNVADVARQVSDKLIQRHPHVYGDVQAATVDDVMSTWESNKMAEKGRTSVMDGIPRQLPALLYAMKVLKRASTAGVELDRAKLDKTDLGTTLLLMVDDARRNGVDPETALRHVVDEFRSRFDTP